MSETPYFGITYIIRIRDRLHRILGRKPSIEEINSQVIGLSYEELQNLIQNEVMNNLLLLAGERNLVIDDIKDECRKWNLPDQSIRSLTSWAEEAGLFGNEQKMPWSESDDERYITSEKKNLPTVEEFVSVEKRIPDFKETVLVGKGEVVRRFHLDTLNEIKESLIEIRQNNGMITTDEFEFELRMGSVPKSYIRELAVFANSLNENGILPQRFQGANTVISNSKKETAADIESSSALSKNKPVKGAMDIDDFGDDDSEEEEDLVKPPLGNSEEDPADRNNEYDLQEPDESDKEASLDVAYKIIADFCRQYSDIKTDSNITILNVGDVKQINIWIEDALSFADPIETIEIEKGNSADVYILDELPFVKGRIAIRAKEQGVTVICLNTEGDKPLYIAVLTI